jgi:hypothetical protein
MQAEAKSIRCENRKFSGKPERIPESRAEFRKIHFLRSTSVHASIWIDIRKEKILRIRKPGKCASRLDADITCDIAVRIGTLGKRSFPHYENSEDCESNMRKESRMWDHRNLYVLIYEDKPAESTFVTSNAIPGNYN